MTFDPEKAVDFLEIFNSSKQHIRRMEGCTHLELLKDTKSSNIFFTYSHWRSENDLNKYRNSEFFESVWSKTKKIFIAKAEAWSVEKFES